MTVVRLRSDILRADRASADRWYITNGSTAVGPVALELVERGVEAGKIPVESYIRHEMWKIWRPLSELCDTETRAPIDPMASPIVPLPLPIPMPASSDSGSFDPRETTMKPAMAPVLPAMPVDPVVRMEPQSTRAPASTARPPQSTRMPASTAKPPQSVRFPVSTTMPPVLSIDDAEEVDPDDVIEDNSRPRIPVPAPSVEDITLPGLPPEEKAAARTMPGATRVDDALLMLSGELLREVGCEGVMVHRVDDDGALTVAAHGPRMFDVIGLRTRLLDPAIVAAAAGILVVAEPTPGPAGQAILARLDTLGVHGNGAAMIPIRPHGRLFGTVEVGQGSPFDAAALAKAEALVRAVQARMEGL
jgi:hypothetical protein